MKTALLIDDFTACGGAETSSLIIAKEFKATIITFSVSEKMKKFIPHDIKIKTLIKKPIDDKDDLIKRRMFSNLDLSDEYDFFIISGNAALCAAKLNRPNIFYCHNIQREAYDDRIIKHLKSRADSLTAKIRLWLYLLKVRVPEPIAVSMDFIRFLFSGKIKYFKYRLTKNSHIKNLKYAQEIIVNSNKVKKEVNDIYKISSTVIHLPINTQRYEYKKPKDFWLSVNRIHPYKRIEIQLETFSKLPNEKLYILGEIQDQKYFTELKKIKPENVEFLGILSGHELIEKFSECIGFIYTSINEDFGIAPVEAMASGKPVIAPNEGALKETVIDGITGKLIDDITAEKLADTIKEIGENPEKYKSACLEHAKKFDTKIFIEKIKRQVEIPNDKIKDEINKNPEVSIIIRAYNEGKYIKECLNAIFKQKTEYPFEVILVDSESTDNTLEIAKNFNVRILKIPRSEFTYGGALNLGCSAAKGKYLVFLSPHAIPIEDNWLDELLKPFDDKTMAVFGKQVPREDATPLKKRFVAETWNNPRAVKYMEFSNTNSAIKKEAWDKVRIDEKVLIAEDRVWARQIKKLGYIIKYNIKAAVYHSHEETLIQAYKRYFKEVYTDVSINRPSLIFTFINDVCHNLVDDVRYIIRKKENLLWIPYALILNCLKLLACIKCALLLCSFFKPIRKKE